MLIKFTGLDGEATNGNGYKWPLPTKNSDGSWTPGEWTETLIGDIELCENGYHYTDSNNCAGWIDREMYEIEVDGEYVSDTDTPAKYACRRARLLRRFTKWNDKTARLFAVRCARDAMTFVDNPDSRSIAAIDVAEKYANGQATDEDLAAAWAAAWAAARAAVWAAARAAAWDAAWVAAWDAAWVAALQKYSSWLMEMVSE